MSDDSLSVTAMFNELVRAGHVRPNGADVPRELPGAFRKVPSISDYATPEAPLRPEAELNAKLGQRSSGNHK